MHLPKPVELSNTKSEPLCKLYNIAISIVAHNCNRCAPPMQGVNGGNQEVGGEGIWELFVLST